LAKIIFKIIIWNPGPDDTTVFKKYLAKKSPVTQTVDGRIEIVTNRTAASTSATSASSVSTFSSPARFSLTLLAYGFCVVILQDDIKKRYCEKILK
jgi:hypothetical protein